jgi:hypothetical protein
MMGSPDAAGLRCQSHSASRPAQNLRRDGVHGRENAISSRVRKAIADVEPLDRAIRWLRRTDEVRALQLQVEALREAASEGDRPADGELVQARARLAAVADRVGSIDRFLDADPSVRPFLSFSPPGHFYSAIPSLAEVERQAEQLFAPAASLPGIDLRVEEQRALLAALAPLARDLDLPEEPQDGWRYGAANDNFGRGDATFLASLLRHLRPARYLEVGSGWSTALALDINGRFLDGAMTITAIEPYPVTLSKLVRPGDDIEIVELPVQDVPLERFATLAPGDVCFIDCSHVVRIGSDAHHLVTRVLPAIPVGVYVHIHDIFWPFEYPRPWIDEGRAWTEAYLVHAFLQFNRSFEIVLFNSWLPWGARDLLDADFPDIVPNPGAGLWLRRIS